MQERPGTRALQAFHERQCNERAEQSSKHLSLASQRAPIPQGEWPPTLRLGWTPPCGKACGRKASHTPLRLDATLWKGLWKKRELL